MEAECVRWIAIWLQQPLLPPLRKDLRAKVMERFDHPLVDNLALVLVILDGFPWLVVIELLFFHLFD